MDFVETGRQVLGREIEGLEAVRASLGEAFARAAACLMAASGRIITTGVGKSGLVARKMASTFSSIGSPATFLHPVEALHGDLGLVRPVDVVVAVSNSGETRELLALLPALARLGCRTVCLTGNPASSLARQTDIAIPVRVPREACHLGIIPTASSTAALAVGDALAACLVDARRVTAEDFFHCHPGGHLGRRLSQLVRHVMVTANLPVAAPGCPVRQALAVLDRGGIGLLMVADAGCRLCGVLTDGDVRRALVRDRLDGAGPVAGLMTRTPRTIRDDRPLNEAIDCMESHAITALPVVDGAGLLVGLIHIHDILGKGSIKFTGGDDGAP